MEVYVVTWHSAMIITVVGVFESEEGAKEFCEEKPECYYEGPFTIQVQDAPSFP